MTKVSSGAGFWRQGRSARTAHRLASWHENRINSPTCSVTAVAILAICFGISASTAREVESLTVGRQHRRLPSPEAAGELIWCHVHRDHGQMLGQSLFSRSAVNSSSFIEQNPASSCGRAALFRRPLCGRDRGIAVPQHTHVKLDWAMAKEWMQSQLSTRLGK